jgi:hypothetical protein
MPEPELWRAAGARLDELHRGSLVQRIDRGWFVHAGQAPKQAQVELVAQDGCRSQDIDGFRAQPGKPSLHGVDDADGNCGPDALTHVPVSG